MERSAETRAAYIAGAQAVYDFAAPLLDPSEQQMLRHWIEVDLEGWTEGDPPPPPQEWVVEPLADNDE